MLKLFGLITAANVEEVLATMHESTVDGAQVRGLVMSEVIDTLRGELHAEAFVASWWDDGVFAARNGGTDGAEAPSWGSPATLPGTWWLTTEHVYKTPRYEHPPGDRLKVVGTAYRRDDFTVRAFFDYWRDIHAPISGMAPGLSAYVVSEVIQRLSGDNDAEAFVEQWWPDRTTLDIASASPEIARAWEDVQKYAKPTGTFWVTREHVEIAPPYTGPGTLER